MSCSLSEGVASQLPSNEDASKEAEESPWLAAVTKQRLANS
jgi:hypothetical protein